MLISNIINDSFGLLSRQLKFYCWHYKQDLDQRQQQELIDILNEHYFEKLANKIKSLLQSNIADGKQQIGKLLFEQCLTGDRRHQLIQLIESDLVDIDVRLDNYGRTLLHRTAYNLDVELVKLLIDHGVDITLRDYAGNTALHIVIQSYRNGALIYNSEPTVVQNLIQIIRLLLDADKNLQKVERQSNNHQSKAHREPSPSSSCSKAQPSNYDESSDESESPKDFHFDPTKSDPKLTTSDTSQSKDITICRMLGSHCMCNNKAVSNKQQQPESREVSKIPKPTNSNQGIDKLKLLGPDQEICVPLVDAKNAFGRTALHYCVLVVGEQHLEQIVKLLISYGARPDVIDTRLKTPLYCLVKRPGVVDQRQKCRAIAQLVESGCDDLGLAITPNSRICENLKKNLDSNTTIPHKSPSDGGEPIFTQSNFRRVPTMKHLARLKLIKMNDDMNGKLRRQMSFNLPEYAPYSLNAYINRKVLDQTELF